MAKKNEDQLGRRDFLRGALIAGGGALAAGRRAAAAEAAPAPAAPAAAPSDAATVYLSFGPDEAGFVEAMVNVMCPADGLTPNGVDCGLALFIDRQMAGGFGQGERLYRRGPFRQGKPELGYQHPLTPEQFFKAGVAAANAACVKAHGQPFAELSAADADRFLQDLGAGRATDPRIPLAEWFNELIYPLFCQACFADPMYGGNKDKVFWKMVGYPGLPAVNQINVVKYRGVPFPGAQAPKSIEDFS